MEKKRYAGSVKELAESGEGQAVFSTLDEIDKDGDVTLKGAFGEQVTPMVPAHNWDAAPIGKARIHEENNEAIADFKLNLHTELGKSWYEALKFDFANPPARQEYSYGFSTREFSFGEFKGQKVRFLKSLTVHEVSPVLIGAGVNTRTLALKRHNPNDLGETIQGAIFDKAKHTGKSAFSLTNEIAAKAGVEQELVYRVLAGDAPIPANGFLAAASTVLGIALDQIGDEPKLAGLQESRRVIAPHTTPTSGNNWDALNHERRVKTDETAAYYKRLYAWQDIDGSATGKSAWRFIHHFVDVEGNPGPASIKACIMGIAALNGARGGTTISEIERRGVWNHLARHLEDAEVSPPVLRGSGETGSKLADQLLLSIWEIEACIDRLEELRQMRGKEGRNLPEERVEQIQELRGLLTRLDDLIKRPVMDGQTAEAMLQFQKMRVRTLELQK